MRLQAQAPLRMRHAVCDCEFGICGAAGAIHGLQEEVIEVQRQKLAWVERGLRIDELKFVSAALNQRSAGLGAYADPIQSLWSGDGSIGLDRDLETADVQCFNKDWVELKQGLSTRADDERLPLARVLRPFLRDGRRESFRGIKFAASCSIYADKISIAELTNRSGAIGFPARPEVASCEAAEDRSAAGLRTLALQRVENFFDGVAHD